MAANTSPEEIRRLRGALAVARRWGNEDADAIKDQLNEKVLEQHIRRIAPQLRNDQKVRLAQLLAEG